MRLKVGRHKKNTVELGDDVALLAEANADRPYFGIMVEDPENDKEDTPLVKEWFHIYNAMGLEYQLAEQQTFLCRCYDFEIAACYVRAMYEYLVRFYLYTYIRSSNTRHYVSKHIAELAGMSLMYVGSQAPNLGGHAVH